MTSKYLMTTDQEDLASSSSSVVGKVRSADMQPLGGGVSFVVYSAGMNPKDCQVPDQVREEMAYIHFDPPSAAGKPREISVALPAFDEDGARQVIKPLKSCVYSELELAHNRAREGKEMREDFPHGIITLKSKGGSLDAYGARATVESCKNMQMTVDGDPSNEVVLQLGKLDKDSFTLDVR